jgi:hypothetical protein
VKVDLNDVVRKRIEGIEKETEQQGLKVRRYEEENHYYKLKF